MDIDDRILMLPENRERTLFCGFVQVQRRDYRLEFSWQRPRGAGRLQCKGLDNLLRRTSDGSAQRELANSQLKARLLGSQLDVKQAFNLLSEWLNSIEEQQQRQQTTTSSSSSSSSSTSTASSSSSSLLALPELNFYKHVLSTFDALGWHRLVSISEIGAGQSNTLCVALQDPSARRHVLSIHFAASYPQTPPRCCRIALPGIDVVGADGGGGGAPRRRRRRQSTRQALAHRCRAFAVLNDAGKEVLLDRVLRQHELGALIEAFEAQLAHFDAFWAVMDDLDADTWTLEPENPTRSSTFRRIALGNNCSLQLDVNPLAPRALPELKLLGAESRIGPLRDALRANLSRWDSAKLTRANLEALLGIALPSPKRTEQQDFKADCNICFTYRLDDGAIPDCSCENSRCPVLFHRDCLLEWLRSLPTSHQSFTTTLGACPHCAQPIHVPN
jgi:E3 ubiquitin-protein ligase FANCL